MKYVKKPVIVEAIRYTGDNYLEICDFTNSILPSFPIENADILIKTLEGTMSLTIGNYLIKGVEGEFYPCREDIFLKTYDEYCE